MSSLRRGHANLLCIVPILADDLFRGSNCPSLFSIYTARFESAKMLCRFYFKKNKNQNFKRGRAGIEPATSPTRRENHTSRPTALGLASNEDRTRDLVLTRHMLCQLSYRGESRRASGPECQQNTRAPGTRRPHEPAHARGRTPVQVIKIFESNLGTGLPDWYSMLGCLEIKGRQ